MCGIGGIISFRDPVEESVLHRMGTAMAHRGPDHLGTSVFDGGGMVHARLSIIDLSPASNQPFISHDGRFRIVFNGEIYNYQELRKQLEGYPFRTSSDTEVLLAAWEKWGKDALTRLEGMFAFALFDTQTRTWFLIRDRFGKKPLYLFRSGDRCFFASEIRTLLASGMVPRMADTAQIWQFLTYQAVSEPHTLIRGLQILQAGTCLEIREGAESTTRWYFPDQTTWRTQAPAGMHACIRELFLRAVRRRMVADVPVAAFLSGGIDSSAVVAAMAQLRSDPVDTFSINFREQEYDESRWSEMIARKYNTRHHPILIGAEDILAEAEPSLIAMDHPSADGVNMFAVSRFTRKEGVKVALSGVGGDELFGGYPHYRTLAKWQHSFLWEIPTGARKLAANLAGYIRKDRNWKARMAFLGMDNPDRIHQYLMFRRLFRPDQLTQLGLAFGKLQPIADRIAFHGVPATHLWSWIALAELETYTRQVLLMDADKMSMAHALEVRAPFFDHELIEYVLSLPDSAKMGVQQKSLLVEALAGWLPDALVNRPKQGFTLPWEHWLRGPLAGLCQEQLSWLDASGFVRSGAGEMLWRRFINHDPDLRWNHIWTLTVLGWWFRSHDIQPKHA